MELLPESIKKTLPKLGSTEGTAGADKVAVVKYFFPAGRYTLYVVEGGQEGDDFTFFGYCVSALGADCDEWGYASLAELRDMKVRGLKMERDLHFKPTKMSEIFKDMK